MQTLRGEATPEDAFDRLWARTMLRWAHGTLREEFRDRGRSETIRELEVFLGAGESAPAYTEVAAKPGQTENTISAAVRRMRQEIADTLATGEDVEAQLRYFLRLQC